MTTEEDREILAGEYVLGTLDPNERAQAERLIATDAAFATRVRYWEGRLTALSDAVEPVEPPSALWTRILGALPAAGGAQIIDLTRRLKRWQTATYVAGALAAALLVFVGVREAYQPRPAGRRQIRCGSAAGQGFAGLPADGRSAAPKIYRAPGRGGERRAIARSSCGSCMTSSRRPARSG